MRCIAHRGVAGPTVPENTLASVSAALDLGVDGIEVDLWFYHGRFWMTHDSLWPGEHRRLNALSHSELIKLRHPNGEPLTDLPELLAIVQDRCLLNLELKNSGGAEHLREVLNAFARDNGISTEHMVISSFNHHELAACQRLMPEVKRAPLIASLPLDYGASLETLAPYSINTSVELLEAELTRDIQRRGYQHWVYTANTADDWRALQKLGVDACFTDRAAALKEYLGASPSPIV